MPTTPGSRSEVDSNRIESALAGSMTALLAPLVQVSELAGTVHATAVAAPFFISVTVQLAVPGSTDDRRTARFRAVQLRFGDSVRVVRLSMMDAAETPLGSP